MSGTSHSASPIIGIRVPGQDEPLPGISARLIREELELLLSKEGLDPDTAGYYAGRLAENLRQASFEGAPDLLVTTNLSDVQPTAVEWLWDGRIPRGMITEIVGDPGVGKSHLALSIAVAETTGRPLPGDEPRDGRHGRVLLVAAEDSAATTIRPRAESMGADLRRIDLLQGIRKSGSERDPDLLDLRQAHHLANLRIHIREYRVTVLVIDPISAYLGNTNSDKDADVRRILTPLARIAAEEGVTVILIRHLNKGADQKALYRAGGSIAISAVSRSSLLVALRPDAPGERVVAQVKGNNSAPPPSVSFTLGAGGITWGHFGRWTADELLAPVPAKRGRKVEQAERFLKDRLASGPVSSNVVFEEGTEQGLSATTLKRALKSLGGDSRRGGYQGGSLWSLPGAGEETLAGKEDASPVRPSSDRNGSAQAPRGSNTRSETIPPSVQDSPAIGPTDGPQEFVSTWDA